MLVLFGLMGMYFLGGDAVGGSASSKVSYDVFKTYVNKGYASKIVVNKDESNLKMYVNPQNIRDVFKQGADRMGKNPYVTTEFGSVDKVETFVEAEKKAGKFKGELNYENKQGNDFFNILLSFGPILLFIFLWLYFMRRMGGRYCCSSSFGFTSCAAWAEAEAEAQAACSTSAKARRRCTRKARTLT